MSSSALDRPLNPAGDCFSDLPAEQQPPPPPQKLPVLHPSGDSDIGPDPQVAPETADWTLPTPVYLDHPLSSADIGDLF